MTNQDSYGAPYREGRGEGDESGSRKARESFWIMIFRYFLVVCPSQISLYDSHSFLWSTLQLTFSDRMRSIFFTGASRIFSPHGFISLWLCLYRIDRIFISYGLTVGKKDINAWTQLGLYAHNFWTNWAMKSRLLRFWRKLKELENLSNRDFLAQFVQKLCTYEHNPYELVLLRSQSQ